MPVSAGPQLRRLPDANLLKRFERYNREVRGCISMRNCLLAIVDWHMRDGWTEICSFLGADCPTQEFPHENRGDYGRSNVAIT